MAVGRVSFSDLRNNDDLSLDELTQKAMQEDVCISFSYYHLSYYHLDFWLKLLCLYCLRYRLF